MSSYSYLAYGRMKRVCKEHGAELVLRPMLLGAVHKEVLESATTGEAKEALKSATGEAVERGVFGAPTFFIGDEMFWGNDRLHFVEAALQKG